MMKKLLISHKIINKLKDKKILIGVSGGVDSMTLLFCLSKYINKDFNFEVLHVNYCFRGTDNDLEKQIVENFCRQNKIIMHYYEYNHDYVINNNFQNDARVFRYELANKICQKNKLDLFISAHNLNDYVETYFIKRIQKRDKINVTLPVEGKYKQMHIFRPLINIPKSQIYDFAVQNNITWNEDYTNHTSKYLRNRIRSKIQKLESKDINILFNWQKKIQQKQNQKFKDTILNKSIKNLKKMSKDTLYNAIYCTLNSIYIYKRSGFVVEVVKLINSSKRYSSLKLNDNLLLIKNNEIIDLFTIKPKKSLQKIVKVSKKEIIFNETKIIFNFEQETEVIIRYIQSNDKILKTEGHKKLKQEFKDKKIEPWRRNSLIVIEHQGKIIYVQDVYKKSKFILITN